MFEREGSGVGQETEGSGDRSISENPDLFYRPDKNGLISLNNYIYGNRDWNGLTRIEFNTIETEILRSRIVI